MKGFQIFLGSQLRSRRIASFYSCNFGKLQDLRFADGECFGVTFDD